MRTERRYEVTVAFQVDADHLSDSCRETATVDVIATSSTEAAQAVNAEFRALMSGEYSRTIAQLAAALERSTRQVNALANKVAQLNANVGSLQKSVRAVADAADCEEALENEF